MQSFTLIPQTDLDKLGDLISYLIVQRELTKPVTRLQDILRDLRLTILNIINEYYPSGCHKVEQQFVKEITDFLEDVSAEIDEEECDQKFADYCFEEVIESFKLSPEIKNANPSKKGKLLDMLVLRSFDFKLKPLIQLIVRTET